jgi:hypothetical protein
VSVAAAIIDMQHGAVFQEDPTRALDVEEKKVDLVRDPKEFTFFLTKKLF